MKWLLVVISLCVSFPSISSQLIVKDGNELFVTLPHKVIENKLEETTFSTQLPWIEGEAEFSGFTVSSLLSHLAIDDAFSVSFIALNDYAASVRVSDVHKYQPIVAYKVDDKKMTVRNKGPYWLVYNLSKYPEIDNAAYHSQMVWQIDEILIHRHKDNEKKTH